MYRYKPGGVEAYVISLLQWVEFKAAKWSSSNDENIGTVDELAAHLRTIIEHERARRAAGELPSSAPAPILRRKSFKDLGHPADVIGAASGCPCIGPLPGALALLLAGRRASLTWWP